MFVLAIKCQLFRKDKAADAEIPEHRKHYKYWDEDSTIVSAKGHYYNNIPCITWKYYDDRRKGYRVSRFDKGEEVEILSVPAKVIYFE